jgi:tetratricopeptide (TPR) repeat protein
MNAMKHGPRIAALTAAALVLVSGWPHEATARSTLRSTDKECADTANAEAAISACTRLYDNRGLGRRNRAIALGNRGAALKVLGRYEEAIADFGRALELDAGNPQYYCQRGDVRMRTGAINDAIADYTTAIQKAPGLLWAFHSRGQAYLAQGNGQLALADFNEALRLKPGNFGLLMLRGRANNLAKSYDAAIGDFSRALKDPSASSLLPKERATILAQRAFALAKADRAGEARGDIDDALRLAPKLAFAVAVGGLVDEKQGKSEQAKDAYTRALAIEPNLALAKAGLDRIGNTGAPASTDAPEPLAQSEPIAPSAAESSAARAPAKEPSAGTDLCAKYIPEIGRTIRIKCAD